MIFEIRPDSVENEYGLYKKTNGSRVCGIYVYPTMGYTRLIWWAGSANLPTLPDRLDTTDLDAIRMLTMSVAESAGDVL